MNELQKAAHDLTTRVAKRVGFVGPPTDTQFSVTQEPYETFSKHGASIDEVSGYLMAEIEKRLSRDEMQAPILYWRVEPQIEKAKGGGYALYARLLLSAKTPDDYVVRPVT